MKIICFLIFLLYICNIHVKGQSGYIGSFYGHFYSYNATTFATKTHDQALEFCASQTYNGLQGYFVTITSELEWDWITSAMTDAGILYPTNSFFELVGMAAYSVDGVEFYYDAGPERGQLVYNLTNDQCNTFCKFSENAPYYPGKISYLNFARNLTSKILYMDNYNPQISLYTICEFSPPDTPGLESSSNVDFTLGENPLYTIFTIRHIPRDRILQKVSFISIDDPSISFDCEDLRITQSSTYQCKYFQYGRFNVTLTAKNYIYPVQYHQSNPPKLSYLKKSYQSDIPSYVISLYGINLKDAVVTFGASNQVTCTHLNSTQFSLNCKLPSGGAVLPITVTVSNVSTRTYNVAIYYPLSGLLNKLSTSYTAFSDIYNKASKFEVLGLRGYMQGIMADIQYQPAIYGANYYIFLNSYNPTINVWMNYESKETSSYVIVQSGPYKGSYMEAYSSSGFPSLGTSVYPIISMSMANGVVSRGIPSTLNGFILEFGGFVPSFEDYILNYNALGEPSAFNLPTSGNVVGIRVIDARITDSMFYISNQLVPIVNYSPFRLDIFFISIPEGFGGPFYLTYYGNGLKSLNTLGFSYNKPKLISVSPSVLPFYGGVITVQGADLGNDENAVSLYLEDSDIKCSDVYINDPHKSFLCILPQGSNSNYKLKVSVGNQESETSLDISYGGFPIVTGYSDVVRNNSVNPTVLTIFGERFVNLAKMDISITIGGKNASRIVVLDSNRITCDFDPNTLPDNDYSPLTIDIKFNDIALETNSFILSSPIFFYDDNLDCLNNCTSRGLCDRTLGICNCFPGYSSNDCSISTLPPNIRPEYVKAFGQTDLTNDHKDIYKFSPYGVRLTDSNDTLFSTIIFKDSYFTSYQPAINEPSIYSDINLISKSSITNTWLNINFTVNPDPISFALQNINQYPYSTNYQLKFQFTTPDLVTISKIEILYLLQYSESVESDKSIQESQNDGCSRDFEVQTDNKQYYNLVNSETIFNAKFTQRIWENDYQSIQKTSLVITDSDPMVNVQRDVAKGYKYKVLSQTIHGDNFVSQVNFAIQKINSDCSNVMIEEDNWKVPLIAVSACLGVLLIVATIIYAIKSNRDMKMKKSKNGDVELRDVRNIRE